ncbi:DUF3971 domain-containing protein [Sneathiella sp.]|uniref:YhdP family protein n=1 Tax=Sneathiella sp. TaxID=1964365 RepID=UPI003567771D
MIVVTSKILLRAALAAIVLVFIAGMVVIAGLARGPMSLTFLGPYVAQALESQYPELDLTFGDLKLAWNGRDKNLAVSVADLEIADNSRKIVSIPDVMVVFSGEALLRGRIAPAKLEFSGAKIRVTRAKSGNIKLGYEYSVMKEAGTSGGTEPEDVQLDSSSRDALRSILTELSRAPDKTTLTGYLERLELYNSSVYIEDEILGKFWQATNTDLFVWREEGGLRGQANGDLKVGARTVSVIAIADYDRATKQTGIDGSFNALPLQLIGEQSPELSILTGIKLVLSGRVHLDLDEEFGFETVGFDVVADEAGTIDMPDLYKQPLPIDSLSVSGDVSGDFTHVDIEKIEATSRGATVALSGAAEQAEAGIGLTLRGEVQNVQADDLGRFWPYSMAVDGYNWVTRNIRDGVVTAATLQLNLPPGAMESGELPADAVRLAFNLEGVSVDYFSPLPKVTDIKGRGVLTATDVALTGLTGKLGDLELTSDKARIYNFDKDMQWADINVHVTGASKEIFTFLDREPLGFAAPYGIDSARMTGTGVVDAAFKFPLRDDLELEQVDYSAKGNFEGAFIPEVTDSIDLSDGNLNVAVDPKGVKVEGTASLNKVPATITAQSWFTGKQAGHRRYAIKSELDNAARVALDVASPYLDGKILADVEIETVPKDGASGQVTLDLTKTKIMAEAMRWSKEADVPGKVTAAIRVTEAGNSTLSDIKVSAGNLSASGEAELSGKELTRLTVPTVRYGENDFGVEFTQTSPEVMTLRISGPQFDLRPFVVGTYDLNEADIDGAAESDRKISIDVDFDKILLDEGLSLNGVKGNLQAEGNLIVSAMVDGKFGDGKAVNLEISKTDGARKVIFLADDAGSLFSGFDLYDDLRDGKLELRATIDDTKKERPATGTIKIKTVRLVNAPVLGKILTVGSLGGIVDLLKGEGVVFDTVEGPFSYVNGVITTRDFRAVGSIGITFTGTIDQPADKIDAFGTVIPSYTLNSVLGNIPILGTLLVGKKGEGIFGFSYKVTGGLEDPQTSVNAVSALAPGILRRMFFEPWDQPDVKPPTTLQDKRQRQ